MKQFIAMVFALAFGVLLLLPAAADAQAKKPNILVIWGDDIGYWNISAYNQGMMGYKTPNIDRIAKEGALFTDWYGEQSCTAGRSAFITGQSGFRTGNLKVGLPGAKEGLQARDVTLAQLLKAQGYMTAQFGKNHLGDADETLPDRARLRRVHGLALPPQRRAGAREPRLLQGSGAEEEIRHARRDPHLGEPRRHAEDREHRPAQHQAHGDDRRGSHQGLARLPREGQEGGQAVLPLVELHPHAHLHAPEEGEPGQDRPRRLSRRHGRARRHGRPAARQAQGTRPRREHDRDVLHRQRRRGDVLARRRHDAVPRREEHQLGGRLPRALRRSAGPASSSPARSTTTSSRTWTCSPRSWPPRACPT